MGYSSAPGPDVRVAGVCEHTVTETMERRKFVIGLGSLAAGGAAATGTGAFTAATVPRQADIGVQNDSNAYLQLRAGGARGVGERVGKDGDGELYIDFDEDAGGSGVNDDSRYQLGAMNDTATGDSIAFESLFDSDSFPKAKGDGEPLATAGVSPPVDQSAFVLSNQSGQTLDIEIGLNTSSSNTNATVYLQGKASAISGSGADSQLDAATATNTSELDLNETGETQDAPGEALSFNNGNPQDEAIPPGESVYVSIQVDTTGGETGAGTVLSEELVISANEAADPGEE